MKSATIKLMILGTVAAAAVIGLFACATKQSMARWHPVEVTAAPNCGDCHTDERTALNHTPEFTARHGLFAVQQKQSCDLCHVESFCADCHANREELKPSDKFKDAVEREFPHRGDYLTRHAIDGRINPASCFKCHGRRNNERCKICHS